MYNPGLTGLVLSLVSGIFVSGYSDAGRYMNDAWMQDVYKRLSDFDDRYLLDDPGLLYSRDYPEISPLNQRGQADIRDSEYLEHSANAANAGYIHMSGGAGEGKQHLTPDGSKANVNEVKSDETLPFYCHPPNPCPKGYTSKDGCQEFIEDTAEAQKTWITKMQEKGMCSCDEEHMFDCPKDGSTVSSQTADDDEYALNDVIDKILGEKHENPYVSGKKRDSLVAKKSPSRIRKSISDKQMEMELEQMKKRANNPYLDGHRLPTVAKKGFNH